MAWLSFLPPGLTEYWEFVVSALLGGEERGVMAERGRRKSWLDRCFFVVRHCRAVFRSDPYQITFSLNRSAM